MKIFIITMDDPIKTNYFISEIIKKRSNDVCGLAISNTNRLTLSKRQSKIKYIFSLFLIMGFYHFFKNSIISILHKVKIYFKIFNKSTLQGVSMKYNIDFIETQNPNNQSFLNKIKDLDVDIIINQSQHILKKELLSIPKMGIINRHNALLPRNRGRLTPFWVLYKKEKETGTSIHFVIDKIDAGDIIIQKKYKIEKNDNFNSIVQKNYNVASIAMLEALDKLEKGDENYIDNNSELSTYNTVPTIKEAWIYRKRKILNYLC